MALRISVQLTVDDSRNEAYAERFNALLEKDESSGVSEVHLVDVYTIDRSFTDREKQKIESLFASTTVEAAKLGSVDAPDRFDYAIMIGFRPGVTDNPGRTAKKTIEDSLKKKFDEYENVYTSRMYFISGKVKRTDAETIASSLHNPLIQYAEVLSFAQYKTKRGFPVVVPNVTLKEKPHVDEVDLWVSDEELEDLGSKGILNVDGTRRGPLALSLDALKVIRNYFHGEKRNPTDIELESLAQTWSEHCKHSIFADPLDEVTEGIYRRYIKGATKAIRKKKGKNDFCVSVFSDNSGAIEFDKEYLITHKVETHNSPSALDPYGGAITGICGVNRDALGFGLGAKPIINLYGYCVGDPRDTRNFYRDEALTQPLLSASRILSGIIEGVNNGGNESGIPTPQGFVTYDDRYRGKPLVFVGTVGLIPKKFKARKLHEKQAQAGDLIVVAGGRVGLDGVHGATFSSVELDLHSPVTAVQIGDPITQKKLSDAIVKDIRDRELYNSITDNGAGGISCSVAEMARECGGCSVAIDTVPLKYPGLSPWQIWISESQERMTFAVPPKKWEAFKQRMDHHDVEVTCIGEFTDSGRCVVTYADATVMDVDMNFLHEGRPIMFQESEQYDVEEVDAPKTSGSEFSKYVLDILKRPNIASLEAISEQYDHEVQGSSVTKPLQGKGLVNSEATVSRPVLTSPKGVVLSQGYAPWLSELDAYAMAANAIDQSVRNIIAAGADPNTIAILDDFCWCSSNDPKRLYQLKEAAEACYDYALAYKAPFISGKDSMFNDFKGYNEDGEFLKISVPPTLLIFSMGLMDNHTDALTIDVKEPGDILYVLGDTYDELAGSEYYTMRTGKSHVWHEKTDVPYVDPEKNFRLYKAFAKANQKGLIESAIGVGRGGLVSALAKTAIAGDHGLAVDLSAHAKDLSTEKKLFSESAGRLVVSVMPENKKKFEQMMKSNRLYKIGVVTDDAEITVVDRNRYVVDVTLQKAYNAYHTNYIPE